MPPRAVSILIVAAWLLVSGRLLVRDLLPRLLPGVPPPFTIDLVEEARLQRVYTEWSVTRDGQQILQARSRVLHPEHDVFELKAEYNPFVKGERVALQGMLLSHMSSIYRVTGSGDLLGVSVRIDGTPQLARWVRVVDRIDVEGQVQGDMFQPTIRLALGKKAIGKIGLPAVRVRRGGAVLLPLHPANRLQGIAPGQSWTMAALDPLADSLASLPGGGGGETRLLRAHVRDEVVPYSHKWRKNVPCLVIDYEGDDLRASTWVEQRGGLVLCQEATLGQETLVMYRE